MQVIPFNRMVDTKRIIGKKWRAEEEERTFPVREQSFEFKIRAQVRRATS
jgi:hypothetical protein